MRLTLAILLVALPLGPALGQSDARIKFLSRQLEKASDPRARAQAALMLGASQDPAALTPLCGGLSDASEVVRSAAARGLGELANPAGAQCLKSRQQEPSAEVRSAIQKALATLTASRRPELYIQMLPIADKTAKLGKDMVKLTEDRLKAKLETLGTLFAPVSESKAEANSVLKAKKLKGYQLKVELQPVPPSGLKLHVVCFTYPGQSLLGEVNVKASGGQAADLIRALAPKAIDEAAETFDWRS